MSRLPRPLSCCGSNDASRWPLTTSGSAEPNRASNRAAHTWSIHGTGASERPISSATNVRSTSVAPSPPTVSGNAIVVAPMPHSRSQRLLSKPDSSAARTVSIEQFVLRSRGTRPAEPDDLRSGCSRFCGVRSDPWSVLLLALEKEGVRIVVEVVLQDLRGQVQGLRLGYDAAHLQHRPVRGIDHFVSSTRSHVVQQAVR